MTPLLVLLAALAVSVEAGWQPLPGGGHEYTVQIEPPLVRMLESGNDLVSDVPADIDVRRLRITLGTGALARVDGPPREHAAPSEHPDIPRAADAFAADAATRPEHPPAGQTAPQDAMTGPAIPAKFDQAATPAQPLAEKAAAEPQSHKTDRPQLGTDPSGSDALSRPWVPLAVAIALLACSLGANVYLGWIARDARQRYRDAVSKWRAPASA
ncbi:MAG: hypothetical protein AB7O59_09190 [Pirellulales bacterium]